MYSIEAGRFHADNNVLELMIISKDIGNHFLNNTCTCFSVFERFHFDKEILIEIKCRYDMNTGCNVNPNKKR